LEANHWADGRMATEHELDLALNDDHGKGSDCVPNGDDISAIEVGGVTRR
jgi:hypothetical protein